MTFEDRISFYKNEIEAALSKCFIGENASYGKLLDSMRYSLLAGGKRLRPMLVLEFCRVSGGSVEASMPIALGIEMLHTYSLIHDDLPCMDDDELRRGKPTNHVVFDEFTSVLAGDALQAEAFASILSAKLPPERVVKCAAALAEAAGQGGICGGQQLDMEGEGKPKNREELLEIHSRKTAALIRAACLMGVAAAGGSVEQEAAALRYADALGMAFQIRDDVLDITATEEELGKSVGSDEASDKTTFATLLGIPECKKLVRRYTDEAKSALEGAFGDTGFLVELAESLVERKY